MSGPVQPQSRASTRRLVRVAELHSAPALLPRTVSVFQPSPDPSDDSALAGAGDPVRLPANAYSRLAAGQPYVPIVPATSVPLESTWRSIGWGLFLCVIF